MKKSGMKCQRCKKSVDDVCVMILSFKLPCVGMKFCTKCALWFLKATGKR